MVRDYEIEKIDKEIIVELNEEQKEAHKKEMTKLEMTKKSKGNSARIFQLKNDVIGSKITSVCQTVETFFHYGCGTTPGIQPRAIARKLWV